MRVLIGKSLLEQVRTLCLELPGSEERPSHGAPTFFVGGKVFTIFADKHHGDTRTTVWLPVPDGLQPGLIAATPQTFFSPPYLGVRGWVGIDLATIRKADLQYHICSAWSLIAPKRLRAAHPEI